MLCAEMCDKAEVQRSSCGISSSVCLLNNDISNYERSTHMVSDGVKSATCIPERAFCDKGVEISVSPGASYHSCISRSKTGFSTVLDFVPARLVV